MAGSHPIITVGAVVDKLEELLGADHRPGIAGQSDHGQCTEDGVNRTSLQTQPPQMGTRQQRPRRLEELGGRGTRRAVRGRAGRSVIAGRNAISLACTRGPVRRRRMRRIDALHRLGEFRLELELPRVDVALHPSSVADTSTRSLNAIPV